MTYRFLPNIIPYVISIEKNSKLPLENKDVI